MNKVKRIWIDMVTAPDVPFFFSVINEIRSRENVEVVVTARNYLEVPELVKKYGMHSVVFIDCFYGKRIVSKIGSLVVRSLQLAVFGLFRKFDAAFSFGSRPQTIAGWLLRIPVVNMIDYEGGEIRLINRLSDIVLVPQAFTPDYLKEIGLPSRKALPYPGLKESAYAYDFVVNKKEIIESGIDGNSVNFVLRMNSIYAHYHEQTKNFDIELIDYLTSFEKVNVVVLPRYTEQRNQIEARAKHNPRIILLKTSISGQNLIWHSDGVISGGGSMIREAVCLGVPAYDMFFGKIGRIEQSLIDNGKVVRLKTVGDFSKITVSKRAGSESVVRDDRLRVFIGDVIEGVVKSTVRAALITVRGAEQAAH